MLKSLVAGIFVLLMLAASPSSGQGVNRQNAPKPSTVPSSGAREQAVPSATASQSAAAQGQPSKYVALVIGNAAYPDAELSLKAPVNNARAMADALREKGFDVVLGENLTRLEMQRAIDT